MLCHQVTKMQKQHGVRSDGFSGESYNMVG